MAPEGHVTLDELRERVAARFGLELDDDRARGLVEVLRAHCATRRADLATCLDQLAHGDVDSTLMAELTVGESYFLRDPAQLEVLANVALPERMARRSDERTLRIVSAGCARGEELYTVAILLRERCPALAGWDLILEGIDLNPLHIELARRAVYSSWSLRRVPDTFRTAWFDRVETGYALDPQIRRMARFDERNLVEDDAAFWAPGSIDILLCRNVLMYFTPEAGQGVLDRFERALAPDGFLFLAPADPRGTSPGLQVREIDDAFVIQKRRPQSARMAPVKLQTRFLRRSAPPQPRTQAVASSPPASSARAAATEATRRQERTARTRPADLARLLELFRQERFDQVLSEVSAARPTASSGTLTPLVRAAALSALGNDDAAEEAARDVLEGDPLNPEAHYLLALCCERKSELEPARRHAEAAVYLDPAFGLAELRLGLLARRTGESARARRELSLAHELLAHEQEERLVLLGGGFSRETLLEMCRAALDATQPGANAEVPR